MKKTWSGCFSGFIVESPEKEFVSQDDAHCRAIKSNKEKHFLYNEYKMLHESFLKRNLSTTRELDLKCAVYSRWQPKMFTFLLIPIGQWNSRFKKIFWRISKLQQKVRKQGVFEKSREKFLAISIEKKEAKEKCTWNFWWAQGFLKIQRGKKKFQRLFS